jgi:hypothetical protein
MLTKSLEQWRQAWHDCFLSHPFAVMAAMWTTVALVVGLMYVWARH